MSSPIPPIPDDIRELLAGYVLGDLDSTEAERLRQLLLQRPELQDEIQALQLALAIVPQSLELAEPDLALRADLMQQAASQALNGKATGAAEQVATESVVPAQVQIGMPQPLRLLRYRLGDGPLGLRPTQGIAAIAASVALILGVSTLRLNRQVTQLEAQLQHNLPASKLIIEPANSAIATLWPGLQDLMQDHGQSVQRKQVADVAALQPGDLAEPLNLTAGELANLPALPYDQGLLLGGSNCQLGKTKGVRLSYQWRGATAVKPPEQPDPAAQTVSAYLLHAPTDDFPQLREGSISLVQADGTNALIWHRGMYLYALVSQLPLDILKTFAHDLEN